MLLFTFVVSGEKNTIISKLHAWKLGYKKKLMLVFILLRQENLGLSGITTVYKGQVISRVPPKNKWENFLHILYVNIQKNLEEIGC